MRSKFVHAATASLVLAAGAAQAADAGARAPVDPLFVPAPVVSDEWILTVKLTVGAAPKYDGADRWGIFAFPGLGFRRAGEPVQFSAPDDGIDFAAVRGQGFSAGPVARFRSGHSFDDDRRLVGLRARDWSVEPGVYVEYWATPFLRARAELRHAIGGGDGFVGDFGLDWVNRLGAFTAALGPRLRLADASYTRDLYGVTPLESALNGRFAAYRPEGGVNSVGAAGSLGYQWTDSWGTTVYARYRRLVSDAARSPIVREIGTPNQFEFGASVSYSFRTRL